MDYTKITDTDWRYPPSTANATGNLVVSENPEHTMHWEEYGNPQGEPVIYIHGGPGAGSSPAVARFFDPKRYRIILFDQRGCGQSRPHVKDDVQASLAGNITHALIRDIETLRADRGITGKAHIFGGSWGSTLAIAYAEAHPEQVQDLILRGIFLCDSTDLRFFYQGNAATPHDSSIPGAYRAYSSDGDYTIPPHLRDVRMAKAYDDAWHDYVSVIPPEERGDMIAAYHRRFHSSKFSAEEKLKAALAWSVWEGVTSYINHDVSDLAKFKEPDFAVAFATIENAYFYRTLHGNDPAISGLLHPENIAKLAPIPTYVVQGAHDQVCVPVSARAFKAALEAAKPAHLDYRETVAGHAMTERETHCVLTDFMDQLPPMHMRSPAAHADSIDTDGLVLVGQPVGNAKA